MKITSIFEKLIIPVIVGLVVLLGQFFIQPRIAKRTVQQQEHWNAKQVAYNRAIKLVNQRFGSAKWTGPAVPSNYTPFSTRPVLKELNNCYTELCLVAENREIPKLFGKIFLQTSSAADRGELISLMRRDLYGASTAIPSDSVIWFFNEKK
ncbi:hypothetical protein CH333_09270 [candidate division WOR-3 bacterium JGI_Cruoil_03_44_89]|uniref:Uncharacterized protein n=1 Tax=candidate division WOR-3 bacterium JGI_Cruoil_03_44_89 TaxID=1973748 RepID=A0A235BND9_UNCW3|nr:MAG: hypothetical protein CH333_09270 [candidate division WOR-3 bacterium JGI_Cruoil_03_44_89]